MARVLQVVDDGIVLGMVQQVGYRKEDFGV